MQSHDGAAVLGVRVGWEEMGNILVNYWKVLGGKQTPSAVDWLAHSLTGLIVLLLSFFKGHITLPSLSITSVHRVSSTYWGSQVRWLEAFGWTGLYHWAVLAPEHSDVSIILSYFLFPSHGGLRACLEYNNKSMLAGVWGCCMREMFGVETSVVRPFTGWTWPQLQGTVKSKQQVEISGKGWSWFPTWEAWLPQGETIVLQKFKKKKSR